jgi:hypothetical protein
MAAWSVSRVSLPHVPLGFTLLTISSDHLPLPYKLHKPDIHVTYLPYVHSKSVIMSQSTVEPVVSGVGISFIPGIKSPKRSREVITNGCPQGGTWKAPGQTWISEKGRSDICKYNIFEAYLSLRRVIQSIDLSRDM